MNLENHYKVWTREHEELLVDLIEEGASWSDIAEILGKTQDAIYRHYIVLLHDSHTDNYKILLQQKLISLGATRPYTKSEEAEAEDFIKESNEDLLAQDESIHQSEESKWTEEQLVSFLKSIYIGQRFFFDINGPYKVARVYVTVNGNVHLETLSGTVYPANKADWVDLIVE